MKPRHRRFAFIALGLIGITLATVLISKALKSNTAYYFSPSKVLAGEAPAEHVFRIGGLVKTGSLKRVGQSLMVNFIITDTAADVPVQYTGILPDLFKEGKGVVARGRLDKDGIFVAEKVLAKHDENYMPPEAADALKKASQAMKKKSTQAEGKTK